MVDIVKETINKTLGANNWNHYRNQYKRGSYSFKQLVELNNAWYRAIKNQEFYDLYKALTFFTLYKRESISVVELGCYRGSLAQKILEENENIEVWLGYDICSLALDERIVTDKRFHPVYMAKQWYEQDHEPFDIFVSTHTLEHLAVPEVRQVIAKIKESCQVGVYLEMPIIEHGKIWAGGASSHVLHWGRKHFRKLFNQDGWKVIYEPRANDNVKAGWSMGTEKQRD